MKVFVVTTSQSEEALSNLEQQFAFIRNVNIEKLGRSTIAARYELLRALLERSAKEGTSSDLVLIFEDNIEFTCDESTALQVIDDACEYLKKNIDISMVFLGYHPNARFLEAPTLHAFARVRHCIHWPAVLFRASTALRVLPRYLPRAHTVRIEQFQWTFKPYLQNADVVISKELIAKGHLKASAARTPIARKKNKYGWFYAQRARCAYGDPCVYAAAFFCCVCAILACPATWALWIGLCVVLLALLLHVPSTSALPLVDYGEVDRSAPIPWVLIKTGPMPLDDPSMQEMKRYWETLEAKEHIEVRYFDDDACVQFLRTHFAPEVLSAYETFKVPQFRADLFRYCALFVLGGVYGDLTQTYLTPLSNLVDVNNDELVLTIDRTTTPWILRCPIQISFMATRKKHPIMKACIDTVVRNVQIRYYGSGPLDITGPSMFGEVVAAYGYPYSLRYRQIAGYLKDTRTNTKVIKTKLDTHTALLQRRRKPAFGTYVTAWIKRDVYH